MRQPGHYKPLHGPVGSLRTASSPTLRTQHRSPPSPPTKLASSVAIQAGILPHRQSQNQHNAAFELALATSAVAREEAQRALVEQVVLIDRLFEHHESVGRVRVLGSMRLTVYKPPLFPDYVCHLWDRIDSCTERGAHASELFDQGAQEPAEYIRRAGGRSDGLACHHGTAFAHMYHHARHVMHSRLATRARRPRMSRKEAHEEGAAHTLSRSETSEHRARAATAIFKSFAEGTAWSWPL